MPIRRWISFLSVAAVLGSVVLLLPSPAGARAAPPTGRWQGFVVISREGVQRGRTPVVVTISSLRLGRDAGYASWAGPPSCVDILRLVRSRAGSWRFSISATIGACLGRSWTYELTRRDARRLRFRATSPLARFRGVVYAGTLVRQA